MVSHQKIKNILRGRIEEDPGARLSVTNRVEYVTAITGILRILRMKKKHKHGLGQICPGLLGIGLQTVVPVEK
jgi:hypothetical protein